MRLLAHTLFEEEPRPTEIACLSGRAAGGETWLAALCVDSAETCTLELSSLEGPNGWRIEGEAYWAYRWTQAGRTFCELLLKEEPAGFPTRYARGGYVPPDLRLTGPVQLPPGVQQVVLRVRVPLCPPGTYSGVLRVGRTLACPIELRVMPFHLARPPQDTMLWYRGTLDPGCRQHRVERHILEHQVRDIHALGFRSLSLREPDGRRAQDLVDFLEAVGFDRHLVWMAPYPSRPLRYRKLTPVFYLSDEPDFHGSRLYRKNAAKARGKTMVSLLRPSDEFPADVHSYAFNEGLLLRWPHLSRRDAYYYWSCHLEKPRLHRELAGWRLWASGAAGISPYCYQHLPIAPSNPFDDSQPWEPYFALNGKLRHHLATYPAREGSIPTLQWLGLGMGLDDLRYLATWRERVGSSPPLPAAGEDLDAWRARLADGILEAM